jgi:large subunit ribosomal protein L25
MRDRGQVPAVLYGHGEETVSLTVLRDQLDAVLRHGGHVVELKGAVSDSALLKAIQWDSLGTQVLHVDLARVSAGERVAVTLAIELRGDAPGSHDGGVVEHPLHEVEIECPVAKIPEKLVVNINHLELNGVIHASDLELPEGAKLLVAPESVVAHCIVVGEAPEGVVGEPGSDEPELIGRKPQEGEEEE